MSSQLNGYLIAKAVNLVVPMHLRSDEDPPIPTPPGKEPPPPIEEPPDKPIVEPGGPVREPGPPEPKRL